MKNSMRLFGLFHVILLAIALAGCASAVDDSGTATSEESAASTSDALKGEETAKATDCASATEVASDDKDYAEFYSTLAKASVSKDSLDLAAGGSCSAACRCCKWGNRFCCSHCRFCSGPIGVTDGVFAP